jgi:hypothetical protein
MDKQQAFKNWYATEGVRTPVPGGEGYSQHEEYQKVAFLAGMELMNEFVCETIDRIHREISKTNNN